MSPSRITVDAAHQRRDRPAAQAPSVPDREVRARESLAAALTVRSQSRSTSARSASAPTAIVPLRGCRPKTRAGAVAVSSAIRSSAIPRRWWPSLSITGSSVATLGKPAAAVQIEPSFLARGREL